MKGVVDSCFPRRRAENLRPNRRCGPTGRLKSVYQRFLARHKIPTAEYQNFTEGRTCAGVSLREKGAPIVIKADGLAAGKGVIVAMTLEEAEAAVHDMLAGQRFWRRGSSHRYRRVPRWRRSELYRDGGRRACAADGYQRDHKRVGDKDTGPNTGGMGAYSPAPVVTDDVHQRTMERIIWPTVKGMAAGRQHLHRFSLCGPDDRQTGQSEGY